MHGELQGFAEIALTEPDAGGDNAAIDYGYV
jgi:hypothetical protein